MMERSFADQRAAVLKNLTHIREQIQRACDEAGRDPATVTLMAVTKTVSPELINVALDAGVTTIGENRVQEYLGKREQLRLDGVDVHLIGHLQTNKVKQIVGKVSTIQSVDSLHLAQVIDKESAKQGLITQVLLEVNVGEEASKSGVTADSAASLLREIAVLPHVHVAGLMAIPPITDDYAEKRRHFSILRQLFIDIAAKNIDNIDMDVLSMGMSNDYYEAILEGATMIRVGSSLFGARM
ncbi:MAG: YggS family pyridoxal phosphate-dependent enzyme [Clostridia bacterium]|nr:YggS family pyridoxal phosphate-dependent enzyme [Clostridia bacterium]